jgi:hypothetical protein
MRGTVQLLALTLAGLAAACAPTLDIASGDREFLSRSRKWDWRPDASSIIDAAPREGSRLHVRLAQLIDDGLCARGFERSYHDADFFVTYHLEVRNQVEIATVPMALYQLDSLHSSPSFLVEGSRTEDRLYRHIRLSIDVTDRDGRTVWQAAVQRRVEGHSALRLEDVVALLLEDFPASALQAD